jgi:hypothetical protein
MYLSRYTFGVFILCSTFGVMTEMEIVDDLRISFIIEFSIIICEGWEIITLSCGLGNFATNRFLFFAAELRNVTTRINKTYYRVSSIIPM